MINDRLIRNYSTQVYMNDMNKTISSKAIFNQRDVKTAIIIMQLVNNKKEKLSLDLTGATVFAKVLKNDDNKSVVECLVLDKENGVVAIAFTEQCLTAIGLNSFELEVQSGEQIMYSPKITYTVVDNLFDENELIKSQDEFPILNSLIHNVQLIEQELLNLNSIVNESESTRNKNEELRKENEIQRGTEFNNIKSTIEEKVNLINKKVGEIDNLISSSQTKIDDEIIKINGNVNLKISEVNNKIAEINNKLLDVDSSISKINTTIAENIKKVDNKIKEVNDLISSINLAFTEKVAEVDAKIIELNESVDNSIKKIETESSRINNNLTSSVNLKIDEIDNKSIGLENKVNQHVGLITDKITECNEKIDIVENLNGQINSAEEVRNTNEIQRNETVQRIVEELEITQTDINDILNMIGGL